MCHLVSSIFTVHFPPGADAALRYTLPKQVEKVSFHGMYIVHQPMGRCWDELFKIDTIDQSVRDYMSRIERFYDFAEGIPNRADYKVTVTLKMERLSQKW